MSSTTYTYCPDFIYTISVSTSSYGNIGSSISASAITIDSDTTTVSIYTETPTDAGVYQVTLTGSLIGAAQPGQSAALPFTVTVTDCTQASLTWSTTGLNDAVTYVITTTSLPIPLPHMTSNYPACPISYTLTDAGASVNPAIFTFTPLLAAYKVAPATPTLAVYSITPQLGQKIYQLTLSGSIITVPTPFTYTLTVELVEKCGDGQNFDTYPNECDDHNNINGDGCDSTCQIEYGWECTAPNSLTADVCTLTGLTTGALADCQAFSETFLSTCGSTTPATSVASMASVTEMCENVNYCSSGNP